MAANVGRVRADRSILASSAPKRAAPIAAQFSNGAAAVDRGFGVGSTSDRDRRSRSG